MINKLGFSDLYKNTINNVFNNSSMTKLICKIEYLSNSKKTAIYTRGKDLYHGEKLNIKINYKDKNNMPYVYEIEYPLSLNKVPIYIKILTFFGLI